MQSNVRNFRLEELERWIEELQRLYDRRKGQKDRLEEERNQVREKLYQVKLEADLYQQVRILLQSAAEHAREQAKLQIEMVVTNALQTIFGSDLRFKVEIREVRERPEAEFYVVSTYGGKVEVETKPEDARGGGVVDVISLALRVALMELSRPRVEGPIVLDEPGKHVSAEYAMNVAEFLRSISHTFQRQVILVTHNTHLAESADLSYRVEIKEGRSQVDKNHSQKF